MSQTCEGDQRQESDMEPEAKLSGWLTEYRFDITPTNKT